MAIDLSFGPQERLIQETVRALFQSECPISLVRDCERAGTTYAAELWRQMADAGWLAMGFPGEYEGLECSFLDQFVLYVEMGRSLAPVPHLETVALAGALICDLGADPQKRALLPAIGSGDAICTLAMMEAEGAFGPESINLVAEQIDGGFRLRGCKTLVPYAADAAKLICVARTGGAGPSGGISLFLVDSSVAGVEVEHTPNIAGYPLYTVSFDGVRASKTELLGEQDRAWPALDRVMTKAAVLQSAQVIGAGERVLEMSVEYAKTRRQFGNAIGKYQAVQYLATDIALDLKATRLLALQAAWRIHTGKSYMREAALACASASKAAAAMTFAAHEIHAGIGFMADYDLQLYTRRAKHWEWNLGDARYHLERVLATAEPGNPSLDDADVLSAR